MGWIRARAEAALAALALIAGCGGGGQVDQVDAAAMDAARPDAGPSADDLAWQDTLAETSARIDQLGIAGAGVAVVIDGRLVYSGGVGVRSRASGAPVTGDTLFRTSSAASKPAIVVALLDLAEEGKLDLHTPVGDIVPEVQLDARYAESIDLGLILLQRSGIGAMPLRTSCAPADTDIIPYFQQIGAIPSVAEPGALWQYSAMGATAGAAVLQTVELRPFTQVISERVLIPAGMTTATYDLAEASQAEHAVGYIGGVAVEPTDRPGFACGERVANTGLYASAADLGRFLELLLAPGRVLEQASLDELQGADHSPGWGPGWSYGYQAYGLDYKGVRVFHHYGASEGFNGGVSWIPERGFGVVLLTNSDDGAGFVNVYTLEELRWWIIDRFLHLPGDPPDNSTPPSTWGKYEGTFASTSQAGTSFTFALDDGDRLTVSITPSRPSPAALVQGGIDVPYEGGDLFNYVNGSGLFLVQFFPDAGGVMHYAAIYSSVAGSHLAVRVP